MWVFSLVITVHFLHMVISILISATLLPGNTIAEYTKWSVSVLKQFGEGNEDTNHDTND